MIHLLMRSPWVPAVPSTTLLEVFVRFRDRGNIDSVPTSARVWLDTDIPALREGTSLEPTAASPTTRVKVNLVATEILRAAPVIELRDSAGLMFERLLPSEDGASNTYAYLSSAPSSVTLPDGEYVVAARQLVDLAGNTRGDVEIGPLLVDGVAPALSNLDVTPRRVGRNGEVTISFTLGEDLPPAGLEVTFGPSRVDDCPRSTSIPIRVDCTYQMTGTELPADTQQAIPIRVWAFDRALNRSALEDSIFGDFLTADLQDIVFAPAPARAGTRALLRATTSEALSQPPILTWSSAQNPGFVWTGNASVDIEHLFAFDVTGAASSGVYAIERVELVDNVGNRSSFDSSNDARFPLEFIVDTEPPQILNVAASPLRVGRVPGQEITLAFEVEEISPLNAPRVALDGADLSTSCTEGQVSPTRSRWSCRYLVTGMEIPADSERVLSLTIDVADRAGNLASSTAPLTFDFIPPTVLSAAFTPESAGSGDLAQLYLGASEPLDPAFAPQLGWTGPSVPFIHQPLRATSFERYFEVLVGANLAAGTYILANVTLRDVAGNEALSDAGVLPLEWLVDPTAPQIQNLTVRVCTGSQSAQCGTQTTPPRVPAIVNRVVRVEFTENETNPAEVAVRCGARDLSSACTVTGAAPSRAWTCLYTTTANEYPAGTETTESCVVDLTDRSSNRASAGVPLIFDYAPPVLSSISILPSPGGLGANAILTMVFSEELETGFVPAIAFTPANRSVPFVHHSSTPFQRTFTYTIIAASTARTYSLSSVTVSVSA
jgi:hypothetical protein